MLVYNTIEKVDETKTMIGDNEMRKVIIVLKMTKSMELIKTTQTYLSGAVLSILY